MVLSESLAHKLFPEGVAVGKRFQAGAWHTVVGIARDVKNVSPAEPAWPEYYVVRKHSLVGTFQNPGQPDGWRHGFLLIRTPLGPDAIANAIRKELAEMAPDLPVTITSMQTRVEKLAQRPRFNAFLLSMFAGMGVMLAAIGLYGVVSFLVSQRTQEIGVRMALGATPRAIARLVLSRAAAWTIGGAVLGLAGALFATRAIRSLLFQVPEHDPWAIAAALLALLAIALAAAWAPAQRAAHVDPMIALRHE